MQVGFELLLAAEVYKCSSESEANLSSLLNCSESADRASTS